MQTLLRQMSFQHIMDSTGFSVSFCFLRFLWVLLLYWVFVCFLEKDLQVEWAGMGEGLERLGGGEEYD